jgi:glucuronate isomerase
MKQFMDQNFLLETKTAELLYHEHAARMPVIDYHCHLSPARMAGNENFENLTQAWLYGDHYKWRAMRANGIAEKYCTGNASDIEKFEKWAETVPYALRNPLYHWTHLELSRYFGISELLNPGSAKKIYREASAMLQTDEFRPLGLLHKMNVEIVCTTDDPVDSLEHHINLKSRETGIRILPTWRPDKLLAVQDPVAFNSYLDALSQASGMGIGNFSKLMDALEKRHAFFHEQGCRLSDHGIEHFYATDYIDRDIQGFFDRLRTGENLDRCERDMFRSAILYELAVMDHQRGWTQQFHIGALRNNNTRMFHENGPDSGYDSIGDFQMAVPMAKFLNRLEAGGKLAKTIIYNLNPADNEVVATMAGNFQDGSVPGKIQWGSSWWFLDQKDGIEKQLNGLSNLGLLSRFVGMLTDSRSFLSYPRHEYFRRILCNLLGNEAENGEIPNDTELLGMMIENICYYNAKNYFKF